MVTRHTDFHSFVRDLLVHRKDDIEQLCYAFGFECQLYTGDEAREVFFGD